MGISSTRRGIRTHAATEEYRNNWARIFESPGTPTPPVVMDKEKAPAPEEPRLDTAANPIASCVAD